MEKSRSTEHKDKDTDDLKSIKYLLGDFGIQILVAIGRGARSKDSILMLSGVPRPCINGRLPVLMSLNLAVQIQDDFYITEKGKSLLKYLGE